MAGELTPRLSVPDDADGLTELRHVAYGELSDQGLNFTAAHQDVATTRARVAEGACWVIQHAGELAATLTMSLPPPQDVRQLTTAAQVPGRAWIGQVAVRSSLRGRNVARRLFGTACEWATARGVSSVGLDTALPAAHLAAMYERWGFERIGLVHFTGNTYDSVVMVRQLSIEQ